MASMKTVEVWVLIDSDGNYAVANDQERVKEVYEEDTQPFGDADGFRLVKLSLRVALPEVIEASGEIPDTDGPVALTVG